jgi:16S rRNA (cytidine1402-2'-O)-methyltransferase
MGTLFIVGTPIGNLEDMTLRGARVLGSVGLIVAEDTRVTRRLLSHLGLRAPLLSYHEHNWRGQLPRVLKALDTGDAALVCDAGMPVVSDPGSELVSQVSKAGYPVEVVPGPSALTAALAVSGFSGDEFAFLGFLPRRRADRRRRLRALAAFPMTLVFFEAPHRLRAMLEDVREELGDRQVALCRELTKLHEEVFRGTVSTALEHAQSPLGEYVVLVEGHSENSPPKDEIALHTAEAAQELVRLREAGIRAKDAVASVAGSMGLPKNLVYRLWVESGL